MSEFFKNWTVNIVIIIVFTTFLEIILPSGNMKKYINMVVGLLIIIVLINPFIKLMTNEINIEKEVFNNIRNAKKYNNQENDELIKLQSYQITELFKSKISKEIKDVIDNSTQYSALDVILDIEEDLNNEKYGEIIKASLLLENKEKNQKGEGENLIQVDSIKKVNVSLDSSFNKASPDNSSQYDSIKEIIEEQFRIPKENIVVYISTVER